MDGIGKNLKRIRLLNNLSLTKASELLNMSPNLIKKYEIGALIPDSSQVIKFANAYHVKTYEILKSYSVIPMQFFHFRKKEKLRGKNLELLKEIIAIEVAKYCEVLEINDNFKIQVEKYPCKNYEEAEEAAIKFRNEVLKLPNIYPTPNLIDILENLGIMIVTIDNPHHKFAGFDGLSEMVNGYPIIVILKDSKDGARQRFTLAHELAHLVLDINSSEEESLCHRFASAILMPKEAVIKEFGIKRLKISLYELKAFKEEYKVSYQAILYRLKDLNIITGNYYRELNILLNKYLANFDSDLIEPEKTYQFKKTVYKLQVTNVISRQKACELLGEDINEYNVKNNNYGY